MAQYLVVAFALVCALLVAEAAVLKKNVLTERVLAAHKKGSLGTTSSNTFSLRHGGSVSAHTMIEGEHALNVLLGNADKRGLKTPFSPASNGKSSKKSYLEVFYIIEFILQNIDFYTYAPCSVGLMAFGEILEDIDWEAVDWEEMTDQHVQAHVLAFVEWWTENKCTEFFDVVFTFNHYVWSIFWDDLEETECGRQLPHKGGSIDWTQAFQHHTRLDWDNVPEPETECEVFELVGEIFLDFFFPTMFDAMPEAVLEDMYNDFGVNDEIDPYFGYEVMEEKYGPEWMDGHDSGSHSRGDKKKDALLSLLKAKNGQ